MDAIAAFDSNLQKILENYVNKPTIIRGFVYLALMLYSARLAPTPPKAVLKLFDNVYFKLFIFSVILWTAQISPSTSILMALAFMITINYTTTGKIWEMLENVGPTPTPNTQLVPTAPTSDIAIQAANTLLNTQKSETPVVSNVTQNPNTMVITPSIVNTPTGPVVVNPSVVISPALVTSSDGKQVLITPSVTTISQPKPVTPEESVQAIMTLGKAAVSTAASDKVAVADVAKVALMNVTSKIGAEAVNKLSEQAVIAVAGVDEKVVEVTKVAIQSCYPMREYDMSKVMPSIGGVFSFEDYAPAPSASL